MGRILKVILRRFIAFIRHFHPTRVVSVGFMLIILTGGLLLSLPVASKSGVGLPFLDALYTSTSATCVTGLILYDTYTQFTLFGQLVIITLIQIGGLGFMTMATFISILFRRAISLRGRLLAMESVNNYGIQGVVRMTKHIIIGTFLMEGAGALILSVKFIPEFGFWNGIYYGIFHSISAFCNAGFDLMGRKDAFCSLTPYVSDFTVNLVIMTLIVVGGLGFVVWEDLYLQSKPSRWKVHTKIVFSMTGFLIFGGALFFAITEWNNPATLGNLPLHGKILASFFQSVTTRTAGFNTVDQAGMTDASILMSTLLMFIGASPGSTGGGIKTVSFAVLLLTIFAGLKGEDYINVFRRRLTAGTILRAVAVFLIGAGIIVCGTMILSITENADFLHVVYEVTSAFATVGISTGISRALSTMGKIVLMVIMYTGRVGVTTVIISLMIKRATRVRHFSYPVERVML